MEDRTPGTPERLAGPVLLSNGKDIMPLYEHTVIARPDLSNQQAQDLSTAFSEVITAQGGTVGKTEYWGLRNLAYRVKNLQITALILDPLDHSRLTPVATLVPEDEPLDGFTLGPLVANRGPVIFSNTTIIPSVVEDLMANSTGLIFRISNYDIVDESGRNFAFASQEVVERTVEWYREHEPWWRRIITGDYLVDRKAARARGNT